MPSWNELEQGRNGETIFFLSKQIKEKGVFGLMRGLRLEELINLSKQSVVVCVPLPSFPKFQESRGRQTGERYVELKS